MRAGVEGPREVEEFLHGHPAIAEVQAIGVPDTRCRENKRTPLAACRLGEELAVWVRLREDGGALSEEEVKEYCRGRLAHFKIPR